MILELRRVSEREVVVTSRFSRYTIEEDDGIIYLSTIGLEREYARGEFPDEAELPAIATYLITQLEVKEIGL